MKWFSACANGACVEVSHQDDRVYVRDGKLGDASEVLSLSAAEFETFCAAAVAWDRKSALLNVGGVALLLPSKTSAIPYDVCVHQQPRCLHFTWQEWDEFVEGVKAGKFDLDPGGVSK